MIKGNPLRFKWPSICFFLLDVFYMVVVWRYYQEELEPKLLATGAAVDDDKFLRGRFRSGLSTVRLIASAKLGYHVSPRIYWYSLADCRYYGDGEKSN